MRRREFLQNSLRGAGAMAAVSLPSSLLAAVVPATVPGVTLARCVGDGAAARWLPLAACAAGCGEQQRVRIDIDALAFPATFEVAAVDAMFATVAGLQPFRIAGFRRDAVSSLSKPFGFEAERSGLAGLRVERRLRDGSAGVASAALLGGIHAQVAPGRYLLVLAPDDADVALATVAVPAAAAAAVTLRDGSTPAFGYLSLRVRDASV